ncbi:MAG: hypothetical protein GWM98_09365, partial [Nitrospinaceae bacterium]|nr:hypothetical protein [Nitrospinaceae bacterium]NIR54663.1 hypothetical protein [Nitrospinaceae bacterium]NIS85080.1 hypothetical protein [Nitrospinaceae bacterium]NIT81897.1 hypothetical protein [Nitrospinaceae bacterium]NIU44161.1 hypothetical protein [Nitrospinaceae bacterium]
EHIIKRVQQVREITRVALAVPHGASEAPLVGLAKRLKVAVIAGPEEDVLARFIQAGETLQAAHLVRVCGDNPLIDLSLLRSLARHHLKTLPDYTVSADPVPLGTGSEIVRLDSLKTIA